MLGRFHAEVQVGNAVEELDVSVGDVPRKFAGGPGVGVGTIVGLVVGDSGQHALGAFCFALDTVEHHGAEAGGEFGSHSLGHIFSFLENLFCLFPG